MEFRNRTLEDSGVRLDGLPIEFVSATGTGITPTQAAAAAAPVLQFLSMFPYVLDEQGHIDYRTNTLALNHTPQLRYGPTHPKAGQLIEAGWNDGAYITRTNGAPMPFIDMDMWPPHTLEKVLAILTALAAAVASTT
jgi:hypothetical protein